MTSPVPRLPGLRPMLPGDVDAATEMVLGHGWGVRRDWLAFATTQPACIPIVADHDGAIVGTGVGTANGAVGWIGSIFIDPGHRGRGLGRALTQAIIDGLESRGCRTLLLVATSEGRRLYERMGFEVQTHYRILEAPGLPAAREPRAPGIRAFEPADLPAIIDLDRIATGEDRAHAFGRLADASSTRVAVGAEGAVVGFVLRPPWGGGATVARSVGEALAIVRARREVSGVDGRVRVGLLQENREGLERLGVDGFRQAWSAPRMLRGEAPAWRPEMIWGQFNHAMG
jgi:GNAT superfamily N-acetyltransferase